jgi:threonine/homoserine/homoserine lactone efflux protein
VQPELYLRGLVIGFAVAFALGPVGLLVIRRTIEHGWRHGFASGLGVASADGTYAALAAFGLTALTSALVGLDRILGLAGGLVLLALGARGLARARLAADPGAAADPEAAARRASAPAAYATMVGLTLTNPATILSFTALFASLGAGTNGAAGAALVTLGVASGSALWWLLLTALVAGLRARLTAGVVRGLNVVASLVIGGFGAVAVAAGLVARP